MYSTTAVTNTSKVLPTVISLVAIWGISILLSFPLFTGMGLEIIELNTTMPPKLVEIIINHTGMLMIWTLIGLVLPEHILVALETYQTSNNYLSLGLNMWHENKSLACIITKELAIQMEQPFCTTYILKNNKIR